ncbi:hypothetical protein [Streptomyces sp. NPDC046909]|uniref:hypothetical protein n=1 Tax=Streptomyces sp. NPDC046909 TaxID=3155617 RepID=UPI0033DE48D9
MMVKLLSRFLVLAGVSGALIWWLGPGTYLYGLLILYVPYAILRMCLFLRQRDAVPSLLTIVVTAAAAFSWLGFIELLDISWYFKAILVCFVSLPLGAASKQLMRVDIRGADAYRGEFAARLVSELLDGGRQARPFSLYLRPFASSDRLPAQMLGPGPVPGDIASYVDVETLLVRALHRTYPLVALGRPGEKSEGAGRVLTDEESWRTAVIRLAASADLVIMVPSANPGTLWEFSHLLTSGQLGKTLFVMPETPQETPSGIAQTVEHDSGMFGMQVRHYAIADHSFDFAGEWARARQAVRAFRIDLPPYTETGALFTLDPETGQVARIVPLALSLLADRVNYLRAAVIELGLLPPKGGKFTGIADAFERCLVPHRRTRVYALTVAAEACRGWGDQALAAALMDRADRVAGRKRSL